MLLTIAKKEFTETFRDGRFRLTFWFLALLLALSLLIGWQTFQQTKTGQEAAQREDHRIWLEHGSQNPHSAAHFGRIIFKPLTPLSFLDRGLNNYLGSSARLEAHVQSPARDRPAEDATVLMRFGELTTATVMQLLVPLLIILLAFGAFAGERETGTLRQLLSLGVPRRILLFGKATGVAGAFLALLFPTTLLGSIALLSYHEPRYHGFARLLFLAIGYGLYFGAFLGLSLVVSALVRHSRLALITLLAFWMFNSLFVPRLSSDIAELVYPTPTNQEFFESLDRDFRNGISGHDTSDQRLAVRQQELMRKYGVSKIDDLPINFQAVALQEGESYGERVYTKHYSEVWDLYNHQAKLRRGLALLAPMLAIQPWSMAFSGTDLAYHRDFLQQSSAFRSRFMNALNSQLLHVKPADSWSYEESQAVWATIPDFHFEMPPMQETISSELPDIATLAFWCAGSFLVAIWAVARMRVEA